MPRNVLEIGVHRGQTLSYFSMLGDHLNYEVNAWGLGPFSGDGDSVSSYGEPIDFVSDITISFGRFNLGEPQLFHGLSQTSSSIDFMKNKEWDLIYVDGSHDYEVVQSDVRTAHESLGERGLLVLDDASLNSDYKPYKFSFAGHSGPSRVAREIRDSGDFVEIGTCGHLRVFRKKRS